MRIKLFLSLLISGVFIYLAFRGINYRLMWESLQRANYWLLLPGVAFMFISLWLRAERWRDFMEPIKRIETPKLFSALMIGYYANNVFPFRLGEFLRAYAIGRSAEVSRMSSFATIFVERLIDIFSLLLLLAVSVLFHDYPGWIERGALMIFAITAVSTLFILFLMERTHQTLRFTSRIMRPFPRRAKALVRKLLASFLEGFTIFKRSEHFWTITWQSVALWLCYGVIIYLGLEAFDLNRAYHLPLGASLVVLVMTSIGIMVPAAPGYVGSFHWICQQALIIFGVSESESLGYAVVMHIVNFVPITLVGFYYYYKQHLDIREAVRTQEIAAPNNGRHAEVAESQPASTQTWSNTMDDDFLKYD